jgi:hypothetical protein
LCIVQPLLRLCCHPAKSISSHPLNPRWHWYELRVFSHFLTFISSIFILRRMALRLSHLLGSHHSRAYQCATLHR